MYDLKYRINIERLTQEDGGGYLVTVPALSGCTADGETPEEAIADARDAIESWLMANRELGRPDPPEEFHIESEYSGKFTARVGATLHKQLAEQAHKEGMSLSQWVNILLSNGVGRYTEYKRAIVQMADTSGSEPNLKVLWEKASKSIKRPIS